MGVTPVSIAHCSRASEAGTQLIRARKGGPRWKLAFAAAGNTLLNMATVYYSDKFDANITVANLNRFPKKIIGGYGANERDSQLR
jgi:hypothetical protein